MLLVLIGDGRTILPVVIGDVKVAVEPPLIVRTSDARVKVTLIKDMKNITTLKEKNSTAMNSRNIIVRKVKWKKENSVMRKLENKKWNKLWMLIGLMNSVFHIRH